LTADRADTAFGRDRAEVEGRLTMHRLTVVSAGVAAVAALVAILGPHVAAQGTDPRRFGAIYVQCPGDNNGNAIPDVLEGTNWDANGNGIPDRNEDADTTNDVPHCMHLAAGDGMVTMADGHPLYTFGFSDVTGKLPSEVMNAGLLGANFPAPTIRLREGENVYLSLTNVGMALRPDLFDSHSIHFHGFPQAASVFDGVPESSTTIHEGSTFTYYYKIVEPGTYMYHCHVEATEHMQMGMLGNLYVEPKQNGTQKIFGGRTYTKFAYNDNDGSTGYDVDYPIQIGSFDPNFHDQHLAIQPLPFAAMRDKYPMLNGRGYPDTVDTAVRSTVTDLGPRPSQPVNSLVTASPNQRVLLRLSNLAVTRFYTLASTIPMQVVGHSARLLRGPTGRNLYYTTNSVTLGGGESVDVIVDTTGLASGSTYLLYTTNLNYLSNDTQDYGGMMTEIRIR
jgi:FtsP/CotA-like multicopper oxidase with cupredoxin domain